MKQAISGPAGIAIVVIIAGILCFFLYSKFMKGPSQITPEEMRANMQKGQQQQQDLGNSKGPRPPGPGGPVPAGR